MPSITLSQIGYRTPDGRTLFDNLTLAFGAVRTGLLGRNGVGKSTLLSLIVGERLPLGGTVSVDGTIGLLRQTVGAGTDATVADSLGITAQLSVLERMDRGEGSAADAGVADWTLPQRMAAVLADVGLGGMAPQRLLVTLSGGQRTRLALAALLLAAPDFLLLDEPTNNLDAAGRDAVADVLSRWRGGAIVVSHDRTLLRDMDAIVELTSLGAASFGGNYDAYRERKAIELAAAEADVSAASRHLAEIDRRAQVQAERKARSDAAGRRRGRQGGTPKIILGALKRRAEATSGSQSRLATRLHESAAAAFNAARSRVEVLQAATVELQPSGLAAGRRVLEARGLSGGPPGLPQIIRRFDLTMIGPARVAITGPNGAGKTTLLRLVTGDLLPQSGSVAIGVPYVMMDQTVSLLDPAETIRDNYRRLNPLEDENACRAALARFRFRAEAALQPVGTLSGGQTILAGLATTIGAGTPPQLLILDEPTNHLDLDAIEAVEAGLRGYDGALLVVSHDRDFLEAIGITEEVVLTAS